MTILIPVIGFLSTTLILLIWYPRQFKTGRLAALYSVESTQTLSSLNSKSLHYKLLASGISIKPVTFQLLRIAICLSGIITAWLFLPGLPALILGGILFYLPGAWLDDHMKARGRNIDSLLPIAIGRIAAGLLAGGSISDVLQQVGESLELEKTTASKANNPLSPELIFTASEMRIKDRREALHSLASRSPSISLSNLAQLLEGYAESGGPAYAGILMDISSRVQQILIARNRAQAKAGDALVSARVLPVVLIFILIFLSQDPMVHASLSALPVQIVLGVTLAAMAGGYLVMRSMIQEAV